MKKPNFFVIGAAKCGTTSLCELLSQHPEVFFSPEKEPRFFSHENRYSKGFKFYDSFFDAASEEKVVGEGSTTYSEAWLDRSEKSAARIYQYSPEAKIVYCVRDPLERIESKWLDLVLSTDNGLINTELFSSGALNLSGDFNKDIKTHPEFVNTSNYWKHLTIYRNYFKDRDIKIIFLEEFREHPLTILKDTCHFLEIDPDFSFQEVHKPRNLTSTKKLSTNIGKMIRSMSGYKAIAYYSPSSVKKLFAPILKKRSVARPEWEIELKLSTINKLQSDSFVFLKYCKKSQDYWQSLIF